MTLNFFSYGASDGPLLLALHGAYGHGQQWAAFADHLPQAQIIAPDLRGHGRSPWTPPWTFEAVVDDLVQLLAEITDQPVLVVGHSFGGAVGLHLARSHPALVRGLVMLDPSIGLSAEQVLMAATDRIEHPDFANPADARRQRQGEGWDEADPRLLEAELAQHLIPTRDGRVGWASEYCCARCVLWRECSGDRTSRR